MPTYEYLCRKCGHAFEEFQSITEDPLRRCPKCGTDSLARAMGTGGAVIFKGSGFYVTDYRKGKSHGAGTGKKGAKKEPAGPEKKDAQETGTGGASAGAAGPQPAPPPAGGTGTKD